MNHNRAERRAIKYGNPFTANRSRYMPLYTLSSMDKDIDEGCSEFFDKSSEFPDPDRTEIWWDEVPNYPQDYLGNLWFL